MSKYKIYLVSLFVVVVLITSGCATPASPQNGAAVPQDAAGNAAQPAATFTAVQPAAEATSAVSAATPGATQAVPQTGSAAGGLVIAVDPANSEARYRVREQLAGRDLPNDAVGKTKSISGSVTINPDGTIDTANSKFTVDLSTLQSDQSMRDNFLRRSVLQTDQFPNATFVPKTVSGLTWPLPQSGPVSFQLAGDLTIRDVTKPVTWEITGDIQDSQAGRASGTATTSFTFAEFNLEQPRVPRVLSIEDNIKLEVDVALQPAVN